MFLLYSSLAFCTGNNSWHDATRIENIMGCFERDGHGILPINIFSSKCLLQPPILETLSFLFTKWTQSKKSNALRQHPVRSIPRGRLKLLWQKTFYNLVIDKLPSTHAPCHARSIQLEGYWLLRQQRASVLLLNYASRAAPSTRAAWPAWVEINSQTTAAPYKMPILSFRLCNVHHPGALMRLLVYL